MQGTLFIITPETAAVELAQKRELTAPPSLEELQGLVGGYLEHLPYLSICRPLVGSADRCLGFCNEDGDAMRLKPNRLATSLWHGSAPKMASSRTLVGTVIFITGDDDLMDSL